VAWRDGDPSAIDDLVAALYDELHRLAHLAMIRESGGHTLQTTALVNEAYLRLLGSDGEWQDRQHFLRVAARAMRQVLVDHARRRKSAKRGSGVVHLDVDGLAPLLSDGSHGGFASRLLELDEALQRLIALDERKGRAVELHYFGGLSYDEVAAVLEISPATVHRDLRMARAWLHTEMRDDD
jgi:RNA polymerase sigma factor (TIGR02999 family)